MDSKQLAQYCCAYADDRKAESPVIMDLRSISSITDFFIVLTGSSTPHLRAIASEIMDKVREDHDMRPRQLDGKGSGTYIKEDTLTDEEVDVVMLDAHAKIKFLELIEYEGDEARAELQEELDKMENDFVESLENTFNEALAETNVVNFMNIFNEQEKKQSQK